MFLLYQHAFKMITIKKGFLNESVFFMSVGIVLMNNDDRRFIDGIKSLEKKEQIKVMRSLLQHLVPEVIKEALKLK